ncbi:arabinofuranosidase [Vararia minispora EC-137]|uniref:Arabinofuranosidase n=1 Tax=Vararia minispora EC-137 TaxID=1314806 RepID=A0ACB8QYZ0_9AGAM|nr:arabinofuranosidase [Vararia minispora EC-137]
MLYVSALSLLVIASGPLLGHAQTIVAVNGTASHPIPKTLWGLMYEDISHSGDGGLYGERLQNRAFQQVAPGTTQALNSWSAIGGALIEVVADTIPLSSALPNSLQVLIPEGAGEVGVENSGYYGIEVNPAWTYNASFFYRFPSILPSGSIAANISLVGAESRTTFAASSVTLNPTADWTQVTTSLTPNSSASDINNTFTVTLDGAAFSGVVNFGLFSLFPPAWMGQENGMREDIAQALFELKPSFFRFPGGNNLEGESIATRWQWNATIGPLVNRPGRVGDWGYVNTDGLGIYEYLIWIELMGMQPIMAVWSGYALGGASVPEADLAPYIEQARQQIEFVVGNTSTPGGALRASLGHSKPFILNYVEIGNEARFTCDFISAAPSTYRSYRWASFVDALQNEYPSIRFIATTRYNNPVLAPKPKSYDLHVYQTPTWFRQNGGYYDSVTRDGTTFFEGEYATTSTNSSNLYGIPEQGRLIYPTVQASVSEAVFMMGFERNSDIVFAASYAPLLGHVTEHQWTPNLLSFDSEQVIKSTSYWVQQMFSANKGDWYLPSTLANTAGTLFWSVVKQDTPLAFILKISNAGTATASLVFELPSAVASSGTLIQLQGSATDSNTPDNPNLIVPVTSTIAAKQNLTFTAPALSLSVITVPLA